MREHIQNVIKKCNTCQLDKRYHTKYGHLPKKEAEVEPWEILCVDLIGPYKIKCKNNKDLQLWCVTMIDPATSWIEIRAIKNKEAIEIAEHVEEAWFTSYPWPTKLNFDRGTEFMGEFKQMAVKDYGVNANPITTRNPQANAIIE